MSTNETLRKIYEQKLGKPISNRTWQRIRHQYLAGEVNLVTVKGLATLRKERPNQPIDLEVFRGFEQIASLLQDLNKEVRGDYLLKAFDSLPSKPSKRTLRRWGVELGIKLQAGNWYTPDQVRAWLRKLLSHPRYGIKQPRKLKSNGTPKNITDRAEFIS